LKKILNFLTIGILIFSFEGWSQNKKYAVFFDKKLSGNPFSLNNPQAFLSQRAIQRRQAQNLSLDSSDLPVIPEYLNQVRNSGASVLYQLRWLNGAIIDCNESQYQAVLNLAFVEGGKPLNTKIQSGPVEKRSKSGIQSLDYGPSQPQNNQLELDSMHAWGYHGEGKLIAVMDAGFLNVNNHQAFSHLIQGQKIIGTRDLVARDGDVYLDHWHGGAVLSNIAAYLPGSLIGGAYSSDYFLIRSEDANTENEIECAYWAVGLELADSAGADIVNSSLGYTTFDTPSLNYDYNSLNGAASIASKTASMAAGKGMVVVNSAGNEGNNSAWGGWISVPADAKNILAAGAIDNTGLQVGFSGKGPTPDGRIKPDLVAMGSGAVTADVSGSSGVTLNNGTSFSAPILTGLVAGFWQAHPGLTAFQVMDALKNSASNRDNPNSTIGWGIPGFIRAHILTGGNPRLRFPFEIVIFPNPGKGNDISIRLLQDAETKEMEYQLTDLKGSSVLSGKFSLRPSQRETMIPTSGLKSGVYHLRINGPEGQLTRKIILN
jgi:serine protease AprX